MHQPLRHPGSHVDAHPQCCTPFESALGVPCSATASLSAEEALVPPNELLLFGPFPVWRFFPEDVKIQLNSDTRTLLRCSQPLSIVVSSVFLEEH
jgi:hypothetical protein